MLSSWLDDAADEANAAAWSAAPSPAAAGPASLSLLDDANWFLGPSVDPTANSFPAVAGGPHLLHHHHLGATSSFSLVGPHGSGSASFLTSLLAGGGGAAASSTSSPTNPFDPTNSSSSSFWNPVTTNMSDLPPLDPQPVTTTTTTTNFGSGSGSGFSFNPNPNAVMSFDAFVDNPPCPKILRPLEPSPAIGAPPTLFQKRALLRQNSCGGKRKMAMIEEDIFDDGSLDIDGSALNYDSDEPGPDNYKKGEEGGSGTNGNNGNAGGEAAGSGGGGKGKKKKGGMPAKNLMAERRRRKKLNDRLYMLRSVVPKISKVTFLIPL